MNYGHARASTPMLAEPLDTPVSSFDLELEGAGKGLLVNSTDLCKKKNRAIADFTGHNGKVFNTEPVLQAKCPKGKKHKRHKRHGRQAALRHRRAAR